MHNIHDFDTVALNEANMCLDIIDQTLLPNELKVLSLSAIPDIFEAIRSLRVRGAPAIGAAAAIGVLLAAHNAVHYPQSDFRDSIHNAAAYLNSARPTAVNLSWALSRMLDCLQHSPPNAPNSDIVSLLLLEAKAIISEDIAMCRALGHFGLQLLSPDSSVLTHCNAGKLAAIRYGTATAPFYIAQERGINLKVYADETRPLLQGARLTAYELYAAGIDVTLLCDNMAASLMKAGSINAVFTGCDRVAANGDTANKIGTLGLAVLAKEFGIPFYIFAPLSSIDFQTSSGDDIIIEHRDPSEVTDLWFAQPMSAENVKVYNPAFDVTDAGLITAIVTPYGIAYPPFSDSLRYMSNKSEAQ